MIFYLLKSDLGSKRTAEDELVDVLLNKGDVKKLIDIQSKIISF
jgi:hypothetical protein